MHMSAHFLTFHYRKFWFVLVPAFSRTVKVKERVIFLLCCAIGNMVQLMGM